MAVSRVGPDLVFGRLWEQLGIGPTIHQALEGRHYGFEVERAIYLTVLHRLLASGSDRAAERWRKSTGCPAPKGWSCITCIGRWLFSGGPMGEQLSRPVLGAPRCVKDGSRRRL